MGAIVATRRNGGRRRKAGSLIIGGLASASAMGLAIGTGAGAVHAASNPTAIFTLGVLTVVGTSQDDAIVVSRDAAGKILLNGGAIPILGGTPTVANTRSVSLLGVGGNDVLTMDEVSGALPKVLMIGGSGDDTMTGGSGADDMIGQSGNDTMLGKGGTDRMFGGGGNDTLTGGDADDQAFGESGDDRMIWNPGDDTDLNEGGADTDTTEVNGGNGAERFTAAANGTRVRFDRVDPAPFAVDMGTTEKLLLNANGGDDAFSTTGDLAPLVAITVDGGAGNDNLLGSNGIDVMLGGDGNDFLDGQQGNDVGLLGAGDDTFQWDPGDGSDVVEGQDGADSMLFNGANAAENFDASANGGRVRFFRNLGNIVMDLDDVETIDLNALAGADNLVVNDLSGTDVTTVDTDLANPIGSGTPDADADAIVVNATNGDDVVVAAGANGTLEVRGLAAALTVAGASPTQDRVTVNALAGDDVVDASGVLAGTIAITADMGEGDDVAIGGEGDDTLLGGAGDDVLLGGPGTDTLDGGTGDNVLIDGENLVAGVVEDDEWVANHTREEGGQTILDTGERSYAIPAADLASA
jgi:Ca2+-binding RTX toxin-like protein